MRFAVFLLLIAAFPALAEKPFAPDRVEGTTRVDADQLAALILSDPELVIIDVRRPEEYAKGHIEGAISLLDTAITGERLERLLPNPERPVAIYCNGERCLRSTHASRKLVESGYRNVYWFRGGWMEWLEQGLPVER